jgi:exonuclease III
MSLKQLKIGSVNIQGGMVKKMDVGVLSKLAAKFDIFCVQETWLYDTKIMTIPGYKHFRSDRKKKKKAKTGSGGSMPFYRCELHKGLTKIESANKDCIWTKLDKTFFGLNTDIYLCNTYIVPEDSVYFNQQETDVLSILKQEINQFSTKGHICLIGDINARTGTTQETFHNDMTEIETQQMDGPSIPEIIWTLI